MTVVVIISENVYPNSFLGVVLQTCFLFWSSGEECKIAAPTKTFDRNVLWTPKFGNPFEKCLPALFY